ncbi:MAG: ABC transporter substrate-binding protein [Desulfobacterium sp.]|jgi:ABC-type nitrate/sulfonate/bicarbonate transport system substrate-binding protein|nr:ABC transporter substrate-binding protein [Desulfobacterium sp.]
MKRLIVLSLAVLFLTGGTGLPVKADDSPPIIRLSYVREIDELPFYVGLEKGFFEEEGVKVELVRIGGATNIMAAALRGDIEGGNIPLAALFHASLRNIPLKLVSWLGTSHPGTKCGIHVSKDSDIQTIKDLKGKRIALSGSITSKTILSEALELEGLTMKDVKPMLGIDLQEPMKHEAILKSSQVHAIIT